MRKLMVPPNPILIEWRNEALSNGDRAKAVRIQRVIEQRMYIDLDTGLFC